MDRGTQDFTLKQIWIPSSDNHLRQIQDVSIYIDCSEEDSGMVRPGHVLRWSFSTERTILSEGWACQDQCYKCWQSDQWMDPFALDISSLNMLTICCEEWSWEKIKQKLTRTGNRSTVRSSWRQSFSQTITTHSRSINPLMLEKRWSVRNTNI